MRKWICHAWRSFSLNYKQFFSAYRKAKDLRTGHCYLELFFFSRSLFYFAFLEPQKKNPKNNAKNVNEHVRTPCGTWTQKEKKMYAFRSIMCVWIVRSVKHGANFWFNLKFWEGKLTFFFVFKVKNYPWQML